MINDNGLRAGMIRNSAALSMLLLSALLTGCGGGEGGGAAKAPGKKGGAGGPAPVVVGKSVEMDVPWEVQVVGNVEAYSTITVKSQISGQLLQAHFREGDFVNKGDLLFSIDRRPLDAQLRQAEATLQKNEAQRRQAEATLARDQAQLKYSRSQAGRYKELMQEGVISKDQNDQVQASSDAMAQLVEADKAAIESSKADAEATRATIENLKVQISYTHITSPITGRTGNLAVKQGNIVTANTSELITINQVQPIYVSFSVPEARLGDIRKFSGQAPLTVSVSQQDTPEEAETGKVTFIDNAVDTTTGTIRLKATVPNGAKKLWPGQFVRVTLRLTTRQNSVVVPNQAVQTGQDGSFIYVVKGDNTVENRPVTPGTRVGNNLVIEKGLAAGEKVVLEGQLRLAPGMKISERPAGARAGKKGPGGDAAAPAAEKGPGSEKNPAADAAPAAGPQPGAEAPPKRGGKKGGKRPEAQ